MQRIHISLPVSDLDASVAFYRAVFGAEASKSRPDYANFRLDEPPIMLALTAARADTPRGGGAHHYGVELPSAETLAAWRARIADAGLGARIEDNATCCYARADKVWVTDPDGHVWELWVRTGDADAMYAPTAVRADIAAAPRTATDSASATADSAAALHPADPACCATCG